MLKKIFIGFFITIVFYAPNAHAFYSKIFNQECKGPEHPHYKGYALNAIDQLQMLITYEENILKERYNESLKERLRVTTYDKDISSVNQAMGRLIKEGVLAYQGVQINYGISSAPPTKEQAQLITRGLNYFFRLNWGESKTFRDGLKEDNPHQATVKKILHVASHQSPEDTMWFPTTDWDVKKTGERGEDNSKDTQGGEYRKTVMYDTFDAIQKGYIAEDGMIVLPDRIENEITKKLRHLPNIIIKDLSPDPKSRFYDKGIDKLTSKNPNYPTNYLVWEGDSVKVARDLRGFLEKGKKIAILNMANQKTPGGGALRHGSRAQEEQLCYRSNLLPTLGNHEKQGAYQNAKGKWGISRLITDQTDCDSGIFSPNISFFRDPAIDDPEDLPHYKFRSDVDSFGIITSAAVDLRSQKKLSNYMQLTKAKIRFQLRAAVVNGFTNVVLGAFGCGAFKGDNPNLPDEVAKYYDDVLKEPEFQGRFENVVFGIMVNSKEDEDNLKAFQEKFPPPAGPGKRK